MLFGGLCPYKLQCGGRRTNIVSMSFLSSAIDFESFACTALGSKKSSLKYSHLLCWAFAHLAVKNKCCFVFRGEIQVERAVISQQPFRSCQSVFVEHTAMATMIWYFLFGCLFGQLVGWGIFYTLSFFLTKILIETTDTMEATAAAKTAAGGGNKKMKCWGKWK